MNKLKTFAITAVAFLCAGNSLYAADDFYKKNLDHACKQINKELSVIEKAGTFINPVTLNKDKSIFYCNYSDWRSGFFPGSVWLLYSMTGNKHYLTLAQKYTKAIEKAKDITWMHDVGFIIGCSFGNGYRLTNNQDYKAVIIKAAQSLSTRFRPGAGIIQSWQANAKWKCPVIIDNMMNLELLFEATRLSGDSTYYNIAVSHANRTLKEHFRPDGSCFHVVDYDPEAGIVRARQTAQGYADWSAWARGQAWAVYGFSMCYRETGDKRYLVQAIKTFNYMKNSPNMPKDYVPYWDMNAPEIPNEPRDASAAAVIASALYGLCRLDQPNAANYKSYADQIMQSLSSKAYLAPIGKNGNFLLMHSTGNKPGNSEVDVPLNYADYYYLEALQRKHELENGIASN